MAIQLFQRYLWKRLSFLHSFALAPFSKISICVGLFLDFLFLWMANVFWEEQNKAL
jgi:hypothetical protein